jgi:hypothetical protein
MHNRIPTPALASLLTVLAVACPLAAGADAKKRDGLVFERDDGTTLRISGMLQFRYIASFTHDAPETDDEFTHGFQMRRAWLNIGGEVNPGFSFYIQSEFSRANGDNSLVDAWIKHALTDNASIKIGQFKLPLMREETTPNSQMLAVDNSITNGVFGQQRSQGVLFEHQSDSLRVAAAFSDGARTANTDFTASRESDAALTARLDWKPVGAWSDLVNFSSFRGKDRAVLLGAAVHWQQGGDTGGTADNDVFIYTLDTSYKDNGWNAFAAFIGRRSDDSRGSFDDFGVVGQASVFITEQAEPFARYDVVIPDDARTGGNDPFNTITAGFNYYISPNSHVAKFTADVQWCLDSQADSASIVSENTGVGLVKDNGDGQAALRLQLQIVF